MAAQVFPPGQQLLHQRVDEADMQTGYGEHVRDAVALKRRVDVLFQISFFPKHQACQQGEAVPVQIRRDPVQKPPLADGQDVQKAGSYLPCLRPVAGRVAEAKDASPF